jgi:hypothetical protein
LSRARTASAVEGDQLARFVALSRRGSFVARRPANPSLELGQINQRSLSGPVDAELARFLGFEHGSVGHEAVFPDGDQRPARFRASQLLERAAGAGFGDCFAELLERPLQPQAASEGVGNPNWVAA